MKKLFILTLLGSITTWGFADQHNKNVREGWSFYECSEKYDLYRTDFDNYYQQDSQRSYQNYQPQPHERHQNNYQQQHNLENVSDQKLNKKNLNDLNTEQSFMTFNNVGFNTHHEIMSLNCVRIGYGAVAPIHEQKLTSLGVKTVGVIETHAEKKMKIIADGFFSCDTYEEAAKLKPHFWDVCIPTDQRLFVIKEILRVDPYAYILLEKPICSIDQIDEFKALEKSNAKFVVNENYLSSQITEKVKKKVFDELKLKPTSIIVEFDKNRIQDFKNGRYQDPRGALNYEGTHMITCLQGLGSQFLPTGNIAKKYEDLFIHTLLPHQGLADISYEVNGIAINLFSSMKGDVKHSFPPYGIDSISENDTKRRYRVIAVKGIDPQGNHATVVGFYEPIEGLRRSQGAIVLIRDEKPKEFEIEYVEDDSMGQHLKKVVNYFKGEEKNPCSVEEAIEAVITLEPMLM